LNDRLVLSGGSIQYFLGADNLNALAMDTPGTVRVDELIGDRVLLEAGGGGSKNIDQGIRIFSVSGFSFPRRLMLHSSMQDRGPFGWRFIRMSKIPAEGGLDYYGLPQLEITGSEPGVISGCGPK
jgi:hypothetical protein